MYTCECGREFDNPQKFNGHKTHCKEHLIAVGKWEKYLEDNKIRSQHSSESQKKLHQEKSHQDLLQWISEQHTCEHCGKIMTEKFSTGRFCSRACANARHHSQEEKEKISLGMKNSEKYNSFLRQNCTRAVRRRVLNERKYCLECGKELSLTNKSGYCMNCFKHSEVCFPLRSKIACDTRDKVRADGRKFGFPPRGQISRPEQFWIGVLEANHIEYQREFKVLKDTGYAYFLDFYVEINNIKLDLEIDGEQHLKAERKASDAERDEYLTTHNYIVYRIPWNDIKSKNGKKLMDEKIDKFLTFIGSHS